MQPHFYAPEGVSSNWNKIQLLFTDTNSGAKFYVMFNDDYVTRDEYDLDCETTDNRIDALEERIDALEQENQDLLNEFYDLVRIIVDLGLVSPAAQLVLKSKLGNAGQDFTTSEL